jgi:hypothetical protein
MREWRKKNPERNRATGKKSDKKRRSANVAKYTAKRMARMHRWKVAHPEEYKKQSREKYRRTRERAISKLGSMCACCGEKRKTMLHIDHIHDDGYIERAGKRNFSYTLIKNVVRMENPWGKYQVLCANCNHSKARNHGLCEHFTEKWSPWFFSDDAPVPSPYKFIPDERRKLEK